MKKILLDWLDYVVTNEIKFNIEYDNSLLRTYDDSSGQRSCYLEYYGYGKQDKVRYPEVFKVKRNLVFTNKGDEGKQGAVLFILNLANPVSKICISERAASFNGFTISLYDKKVNLDGL